MHDTCMLYTRSDFACIFLVLNPLRILIYRKGIEDKKYYEQNIYKKNSQSYKQKDIQTENKEARTGMSETRFGSSRPRPRLKMSESQ